ncbi:MAG: 2Fe-2S iron-sulfur cluster-binding protein [Gammaproteobacteria bacterium]|nr:2Fe-2S iron-sulfur cluster-binding protein [Gammaproteobacteria bacterium]
MTRLSLTVNGEAITVESASSTPLLYVLRDELALNGPRYGCGQGHCGACRIMVAAYHLLGRDRRRRTPRGDAMTLPASLEQNPRLADWVTFEDDRAVIHTGKVELGQGIKTAGGDRQCDLRCHRTSHPRNSIHPRPAACSRTGKLTSKQQTGTDHDEFVP